MLLTVITLRHNTTVNKKSNYLNQLWSQLHLSKYSSPFPSVPTLQSLKNFDCSLTENWQYACHREWK